MQTMCVAADSPLVIQINYFIGKSKSGQTIGDDYFWFFWHVFVYIFQLWYVAFINTASFGLTKSTLKTLISHPKSSLEQYSFIVIEINHYCDTGLLPALINLLISCGKLNPSHWSSRFHVIVNNCSSSSVGHVLINLFSSFSLNYLQKYIWNFTENNQNLLFVFFGLISMYIVFSTGCIQ